VQLCLLGVHQAMDPATGFVDRQELAGIKVVDFSAVVAGPYCTRLMADSGADVVKVEPPTGDHLRTVPPVRDGVSAYFGVMNAGKRAIVLDLRREDGQAAALELIDWADVVVENYRPGVMARFGLDYDTVAARRPDIVYCSVSGYGQVGPWIGRPALAQVVHATTGYDMALLAHQRGMDTPPVAGLFVADVLAATLALGGVLTALRAKEKTGVGRYIDLALIDGMLSLMVSEVMSAQFPGGSNSRGYPPFRTSDGFVMIAAISQRLFEALARTLGRPDLIDDPRFLTNSLRWQNTRELEAIVEEWTSVRTADECERVMLAGGVPASRYRTVAEQFDNEQVQARGTFITAEDSAGQYQIVDSPMHFRPPASVASLLPDKPVLRVPGFGSDTTAVLTEVLGSARAEELLASGAAIQGVPSETQAPERQAV
jgi:CoA:oxalate CoA-transferase